MCVDAHVYVCICNVSIMMYCGMHVCARTHTHVLHINIHTHMQICASMTYIKQIHALVNVSVYVCVCVYVYVYAIYIHMHMYTYTYTHRHLNYECMYICTFWHVRFVDSFQCLGT